MFIYEICFTFYLLVSNKYVLLALTEHGSCRSQKQICADIKREGFPKKAGVKTWGISPLNVNIQTSTIYCSMYSMYNVV